MNDNRKPSDEGKKSAKDGRTGGNSSYRGMFPEESPLTEREIRIEPNVRDAVNERTRRLTVTTDDVRDGVLCALMLIVFALAQTTLFSIFRPFGAVPDLILPLVIAVAMAKREKWGAIFGVIAAFVIESLGGERVTVLSLLYMPTGFICGAAVVCWLRDSFAVRATFTLCAAAARMFITLAVSLSSVGGITLISALTSAVIPEFFATLLLSPLPHIICRLLIRRGRSYPE